MIRLPASKAREKFSEILNEVAYGNERLVLQRHGKDLVAVISAEDLARLEELEDRADLKLMEKVIAQGYAPVPWHEARKRLKAE
jgi:prevent-host-death family protein